MVLESNTENGRIDPLESAIAGISGSTDGNVVDQRIFGASRKSEPQRMGKAEAPGGIFLDAVDDALAIDVRGHAVEYQVADRIGVKCSWL